MSSEIARVELKAGLLTDHPWVYGQHLDFEKTPGIPNGSIGELVDSEGRFLARGHFSRRARIGFRVLSRKEDETINGDWILKKIRTAYEQRLQTIAIGAETNAYRLVHSEGDGLSGLVIDIYNDVAVIEFFSKGMFMMRREIEAAIRVQLPEIQRVHMFAEQRIQKQEAFDLWKSDDSWETVITESGVRYRVRPDLKHKTGFYLDQRMQRQAVQKFAAGCRVLDLCSFAGGFALSAARGGASQTIAVELDPEAVKLGQENSQLNALNVEWVQADLRETVLREDIVGKMDLVILDPAKITRDRNKVHEALGVYRGLNASAMKAVRSGGMLLTCSCTGLVSEDDFIKSVRLAARDCGRQVKIFSIAGVSPDHPFNVNCPDSRYLKALWCFVEDQ